MILRNAISAVKEVQSFRGAYLENADAPKNRMLRKDARLQLAVSKGFIAGVGACDMRCGQ